MRADARYLLRLWTDGDAEHRRASMVDLRSGDVHHFARLALLYAFLEAHASSTDDGPADPTTTGGNTFANNALGDVAP